MHLDQDDEISRALDIENSSVCFQFFVPFNCLKIVPNIFTSMSNPSKVPNEIFLLLDYWNSGLKIKYLGGYFEMMIRNTGVIFFLLTQFFKLRFR